jgi:cell surface protein SprA
VRKISDNTHTPNAGQNVISVKITGDYAVTQSLNVRLFYDYVLNIPVISNTFKTANTNFGVSIRFSIS